MIDIDIPLPPVVSKASSAILTDAPDPVAGYRAICAALPIPPASQRMRCRGPRYTPPREQAETVLLAQKRQRRALEGLAAAEGVVTRARAELAKAMEG